MISLDLFSNFSESTTAPYSRSWVIIACQSRREETYQFSLSAKSIHGLNLWIWTGRMREGLQGAGPKLTKTSWHGKNAPTKKMTHTSYCTCPCLKKSWLEPLTQMSFLRLPKWLTLMLMSCGLLLALENNSGSWQFIISPLSCVLKKPNHFLCCMPLEVATRAPSPEEVTDHMECLCSDYRCLGWLNYHPFQSGYLRSTRNSSEDLSYFFRAEQVQWTKPDNSSFWKGQITVENTTNKSGPSRSHKRSNVPGRQSMAECFNSLSRPFMSSQLGLKREEEEWKPVWTVLP